MITTIFISPDGVEFRNLPKTWRNTTNISESWALAHGWNKTEREIPDPPEPPSKYSKYKLHHALDSEGLWGSFWDAISRAGYSQYWNDAQELSEDDEMFVAVLQMLTTGAPGEEAIIRADKSVIDEILDKARI